MKFMDTCVLYASFFRNEKSHAEAKGLMESVLKAKERMVYSDYILDELLTLAKKRKGRKIAAQILDVMVSSEIELVKVSDGDISLALEIFRGYDGLSFTDATSVAIMLERGITEICSFDRGFDAVPKISRIAGKAGK